MNWFEKICEWVAPSALFEMTNLRQDKTGLPFVVFVSQRGGARHDVRIKVSDSSNPRPGEMRVVAVRPEVRLIHGKMSKEDLALLARWIDLNRDVIVEFWDSQEMDSIDLFKRLRRLP